VPSLTVHAHVVASDRVGDGVVDDDHVRFGHHLVGGSCSSCVFEERVTCSFEEKKKRE
jgi:hypothetical protein